MNEKKYFIGLITVLLIVVFILTVYLISNQKDFTDNNTILYELTYFDDYNPGSTYKISIFEKTIQIVKTNSCSAVDCKANIEKHQYKYSKENMNKLKRFIENIDSKLLKQDLILPQDLSEYQKDVIMGILFGEYFFEIAVEEYKYKIEYSASDKVSYDIYFKEDNSILVKKLRINNDYDITKIDIYEINFSSENMQIINDYVEKLALQRESKVIHKSSILYKNEKDIVLSIIENNEDHLMNRKPIEIAYKISYDGINCPTPTVILYTDNTFEYYYAYTSNYESLKVKEGIYDYNHMVSLLGSSSLERIYNVTTDYIISDNDGNYYYGYDRDLLHKFFNENSINLTTCLQS